jgi:hypothetical protein
MIDELDAINALDIMLTQPIFVSKGEIQTITGYEREDFEETLDKLRTDNALQPRDFLIVQQALGALTAFHIPPEILVERFGENHEAAIDAMIRKINDHLE